MRIHGPMILCLASWLGGVAQAQTRVAESPPWFDRSYQYRMRVHVETERSGWQVVPIHETALVDALNRIEEMRFDPNYFAYNHLRVLRENAAGSAVDVGNQAGFFLVPDGEPLFSVDGKEDRQDIQIPSAAGTRYLLEYVCDGGKEPLNPYTPTFRPGDKDRKHLHLASYEPALLAKENRRRESLILSGGGTLSFALQKPQLSKLDACRLRKVQVVFLAQFEAPGMHTLDLYYQPMGGHFLHIPRLRRPDLPNATARTVRVGPAEKLTGDTRYRLAANDAIEVWFGETTVKLTPNTPSPEEARPAICILQGANEKQSFQVVLGPKRPYRFAGVRATDLRNGDAAIPQDQIDFRRIDYVPIRKSSFITPVHYQGLIGDPLVPVAAQIVSPADGNLALWATVKTSADQAPGVYRGAIEIEIDARPPLALPLEVEVCSFALPEFSPLQSNLGGKFFVHKAENSRAMTDYHGVKESAEVRKLAAAHYDAMAENKFTPYNVAAYIDVGMKWSPPPMGCNQDGNGNFFRLHDWDFGAYNQALTRYVDALKVNSICIWHTNPTVCNRIALPGNKGLNAPPDLTPGQPIPASSAGITVAWDKSPDDPADLVEITQAQFDRLLLDYFRAVAKNLDEHGWLERAHILVDETHNDKRLLHFLRLLKSDPLTARIRVVCCIQDLTYFTNPAYQGLLDTYMPQIDENYNRWEPYYFSDYGIAPDWRKLACYVVVSSRTSIDSTGMSNRIVGLDLFHRGASFYHIWETAYYGVEDESRRHSPTANPWQDPITPWGNGVLCYFYPPRKSDFPAEPDYTVTPSLRVMTHREAVDDYEYARMLADLAAEGAQRGIKRRDVEAVLADIGKLFDERVSWSQNDAWHCELRQRMARAIVSLKEDLGAR